MIPMIGNIWVDVSGHAGTRENCAAHPIERRVLRVAANEIYGEESDARNRVDGAGLDDGDRHGDKRPLRTNPCDLLSGEPDAGRDERCGVRISKSDGRAGQARDPLVQHTFVARVRVKNPVIQPVSADAKTSCPSLRIAHSYTTPMPVTAEGESESGLVG